MSCRQVCGHRAVAEHQPDPARSAGVAPVGLRGEGGTGHFEAGGEDVRTLALRQRPEQQRQPTGRQPELLAKTRPRGRAAGKRVEVLAVDAGRDDPRRGSEPLNVYGGIRRVRHDGIGVASHQAGQNPVNPASHRVIGHVAAVSVGQQRPPPNPGRD